MGAHIFNIGEGLDASFDPVHTDEKILADLDPFFPLIDPSKKDSMLEVIRKASEDQTSVGGVVECAITGMPAGIGEPFFDSAESMTAHLLFSVPGVKGVEFGAGFKLAAMRGHEANDSIFVENGRVQTRTNHAGGINGGLTNGMPIIVRAVFRPVSSISREQETIDILSMQNTKCRVAGRHDACIVPRAVVVVEAMCALAVLDLMGRIGNGIGRASRQDR